MNINMLKPSVTNSVKRALSTASPTGKLKMVVFGGGGYVGSRVVQQALNAGHSVVSVNRSSNPDSPSSTYNDRLTWRVGNIFDESTYEKDLEDCDVAVSCVGAFGSEEFMQRINGDGNIHAITQAKAKGVPRFIYVSTVENNLPSFFLRGYFEGKRRAEEALLSAFPAAGAGVVLRPSFMYGSRSISKDVSLPLGLLGRPLEAVLNNRGAAWLRESVPGMLALLAPPISVDAVASAVVKVAEGEEQARALCANPPHSQRTNILSRDDIALVAAIQP